MIEHPSSYWNLPKGGPAEAALGYLIAVAMAAFAVAGCASAASHPAAAGRAAAGSGSALATATPGTTAAPSPHSHHRHHHGSHSCDASLWQHVYHPDRLHVVGQCMTVRGTVTEVRREPDGDLHILLAGHSALVNSANVTYEHGDLVLEEICQGPVTQ